TTMRAPGTLDRGRLGSCRSAEAQARSRTSQCARCECGVVSDGCARRHRRMVLEQRLADALYPAESLVVDQSPLRRRLLCLADPALVWIPFGGHRVRREAAPARMHE